MLFSTVIIKNEFDIVYDEFSHIKKLLTQMTLEIINHHACNCGTFRYKTIMHKNKISKFT